MSLLWAMARKATGWNVHFIISFKAARMKRMVRNNQSNYIYRKKITGCVAVLILIQYNYLEEGY